MGKKSVDAVVDVGHEVGCFRTRNVTEHRPTDRRPLWDRSQKPGWQ